MISCVEMGPAWTRESTSRAKEIYNRKLIMGGKLVQFNLAVLLMLSIIQPRHQVRSELAARKSGLTMDAGRAPKDHGEEASLRRAQ